MKATDADKKLLRKGDFVRNTRNGDLGIIGSARVDKCGQIPVLFVGARIVLWIEPYKLERVCP